MVIIHAACSAVVITDLANVKLMSGIYTKQLSNKTEFDILGNKLDWGIGAYGNGRPLEPLTPTPVCINIRQHRLHSKCPE